MKYEYKCKEGHLTDVVRPIDERDKKAKCGQCGKVAKRQLIQSIPFAFRGAFFDGPPGGN